MKIKIIVLSIALCFFYMCNKSEELPEISIPDELKEGAWRFQKIEDNAGSIILSGEGEPELVFWFKENGILTGRQKGFYNIENGVLFFKASIDTTYWIQGEDYFLERFPQRYYDFESIVENGIEGKVQFKENGWDSEFYIQIDSTKKMWFQRY